MDRAYPYIGEYRGYVVGAHGLRVRFTSPQNGYVVHPADRFKVGEVHDTWDEPSFRVVAISTSPLEQQILEYLNGV